MSTQAFAPGISTSFIASLGAAKCSKFVTNTLVKRKYANGTAASYGQVYGSGYQWVHSNWRVINGLVNLGNDELTVYGAYDGAKTLLQVKQISSALRAANAVGPLQGLVLVLEWTAHKNNVELNSCLMSVADVSLDIAADAAAMSTAPAGIGLALGVLSFALTIVDVSNLAVSCKPK